MGVVEGTAVGETEEEIVGVAVEASEMGFDSGAAMVAAALFSLGVRAVLRGGSMRGTSEGAVA